MDPSLAWIVTWLSSTFRSLEFWSENAFCDSTSLNWASVVCTFPVSFLGVVYGAPRRRRDVSAPDPSTGAGSADGSADGGGVAVLVAAAAAVGQVVHRRGLAAVGRD